MTTASGTSDVQLVQYCEKYGSFIPATSILSVGCIQCMSGFINVGGFCVANLTQANYTCNVENCEYCIQNNFCGQCEEGYITILYTGGQCWKTYSPLPNCKITTLYHPVCQACNEGYVLSSSFECIPVSNITCNISGCMYCYT